MNIRCLMLTMGLSLGAASPAAAASGSGFSYLKIGAGARAAAMGSAFTAVSNDATAVYWNPAGLAQLGQKELSVMHGEWLLGSQYDFLAYAHPMAGWGTAGFGFSRLAQPPQQGRGENREKTPDFGAEDMAFTLAYSRSIFSGNHLGVGLKWIRSGIGTDVGQGLAVDLGETYRPAFLPVSFGIAVRNLGPAIKFSQESTQLPLTLSGGAAVYTAPGLTLAADAQYRPYDRKTGFNVGTEYNLLAALGNIPEDSCPERSFRGAFAVRAGYQSLANASSDGNAGGVSLLSGLSGGFGVRLFKYQVDYALTPFGGLGQTHRIGLSTRF